MHCQAFRVHRRRGRLDAEPGRVPVRAGRQEPEPVPVQEQRVPALVPEPRVPGPVRVRALAGRQVPVRVQRVPGPERAPRVPVRAARQVRVQRVPGPVQPERVQVLELAPERVPVLELVPVQADRWTPVLKVPQVAHLGSRRLPLETHKCRY